MVRINHEIDTIETPPLPPITGFPPFLLKIAHSQSITAIFENCHPPPPKGEGGGGVHHMIFLNIN